MRTRKPSTASRSRRCAARVLAIGSHAQSRIAAEAQKCDGASVRISSLTDFAWERVRRIRSLLIAGRIDRDLGFSWSGAGATGIRDNDGIALLVFVHDRAVVRYVTPSRNEAELTEVKSPGGLSRSEARFVIRIRDRGRRVLQLADSHESGRASFCTGSSRGCRGVAPRVPKRLAGDSRLTLRGAAAPTGGEPMRLASRRSAATVFVCLIWMAAPGTGGRRRPLRSHPRRHRSGDAVGHLRKRRHRCQHGSGRLRARGRSNPGEFVESWRVRRADRPCRPGNRSQAANNPAGQPRSGSASSRTSASHGWCRLASRSRSHGKPPCPRTRGRARKRSRRSPGRSPSTSGSGSITVGRIEDAVQVRTGSGSIKVEGAGHGVAASSGSGSIRTSAR